MTTVTPPTPPAAPASPTPAGRSPRRGRIVAATGVIAIAAVTVAVLVSGRGSSTDADPSPVPTPYTGPISPAFVADGCLGGAGPEAGALGNPDLSKIVLAAQKAAPLTEKGAAEFTAALLRWSTESPRPPGKAAAAAQILAPDATDAARKHLALPVTKGTTSRADFNDGRYLVDSFDPGSAGAGARAVVSWLAVGHSTQDGTAMDDVTFGGTAHLVAVGGAWRLQDESAGRSVEEMQRVGIPYAGGC
jgi:hypothetical protein